MLASKEIALFYGMLLLSGSGAHHHDSYSNSKYGGRSEQENERIPPCGIRASIAGVTGAFLTNTGLFASRFGGVGVELGAPMVEEGVTRCAVALCCGHKNMNECAEAVSWSKLIETCAPNACRTGRIGRKDIFEWCPEFLNFAYYWNRKL